MHSLSSGGFVGCFFVPCFSGGGAAWVEKGDIINRRTK